MTSEEEEEERQRVTSYDYVDFYTFNFGLSEIKTN